MKIKGKQIKSVVKLNAILNLAGDRKQDYQVLLQKTKFDKTISRQKSEISHEELRMELVRNKVMKKFFDKLKQLLVTWKI